MARPRYTWMALLLCLTGGARGQVEDLGQGWYLSEGQCAVVHITAEEARRRALEQARQRAVEFAVGIEAKAAALLRREESRGQVHEAFFQLSQQLSAGRVTAEGEPRWSVEEVPAEPSPIAVYRVRLKVRVEAEKGRPDPGFGLSLRLNKDRFRPGEEMRLAIAASRPCYVTVLCLTGTDTVVVLLPHRYRPGRFVAPGDTLRLPDAEEERMGIRYRVAAPAGGNATEMIKVVATLQDRRFGGPPRAGQVYNQIPTPQEAIGALMRWLVAIPRHERAEAEAVYQILAP